MFKTPSFKIFSYQSFIVLCHGVAVVDDVVAVLLVEPGSKDTIVLSRVADPDGFYPDPGPSHCLRNKNRLLIFSFDIKVNVIDILKLYYHFGQ